MYAPIDFYPTLTWQKNMLPWSSAEVRVRKKNTINKTQQNLRIRVFLPVAFVGVLLRTPYKVDPYKLIGPFWGELLCQFFHGKLYASESSPKFDI